MKVSGRSQVLAVTGVVLVAVVAAVLIRPGRSAAPPLADRIRRFVTALHEDDPYQPPDEPDRRRFAEALTHLADSVRAGSEELRALGLAVEQGIDEQTGRPYALVAGGRGQGLYVVDLSQPARLAVQVPHPVNDLHTTEIGVELFRRIPGAVLAVSGTHRRAADGAGDVAHNTDSMFHALASEQARLHLPQVQLHGFDDRSLPTADVVLSPGTGQAGDLISRVADELAGSLRVCRAWLRTCGALEGTRNAQGAVAAANATTFIHVEISRTVRDAPARWTAVVDGIAKTIGH